MGRVSFTTEQRIAVLSLLSANGGNIALTSAQSGVSPNTIRSWRDKFSAARSPELQVAVMSASAKISEISARSLAASLARLDSVAEKAVARVLELLPMETDLAKVNTCLRLTCEVLLKLKDAEARDSSVISPSLSSEISHAVARLTSYSDAVEIDS